MTTDAPTRIAKPAAASVCERILIGVDGGKGALDACRQATRLAGPGATVEAAFVSLYPPATARALGVEAVAERIERTSSVALAAAGRILGPHAALRRLQGFTVEALLDEVRRLQVTLLALGPPEHARIEEIVLGGVGGELLHKAPCSILVARPVPNEASFPRSIVAGIDGSESADRAYEVADQLATRFHSELAGVVADGGKHVDLALIRRRHPGVELAAGSPVSALVEAASCADLLVVGNRGRHGLRALGSVSERIAHEAACSVLVVR